MNLKQIEIAWRPSIAATLLALSLVAASVAVAEEPEASDETPQAAMENTGSPGMNLPFNGESIESFEDSLKSIQAETTEAEFTTIQNALDYLLVYDLAARRDRELLYKRLDGKTPREVIDMVRWRQGGTVSDGR